VFILVSVPSPFTARLWCGARTSGSPRLSRNPQCHGGKSITGASAASKPVSFAQPAICSGLGRISAPPDSLRFERIEHRQILDAAVGSSSPGKLVSGTAPDGSL
jgi:hypothetical protein